jgi:hypothetical protein
LFGYRLEPDFDLAKEQRRDRVGWILIGGTLIALFFSGNLRAELAQAYFSSVLCYGGNFYVDRKDDLGKLWLWKVIFVTVPLHLLYLAAVFWSDKQFPSVMTKAIVFIPLLFVGFGIESIVIDRIVGHFKPSKADQTTGPVVAGGASLKQ